ncbi:hypothetical protein GN244_ATG02185 [Phytophthora infestans]|uniref:Uncharacterized protein n=1 Tax=Phytophthora infestans TaxID=4787 RepID=A0A833WM92_PHYIN|nr:hypothetical protein GN244_ATG02185 [Phytophthora infestans]KAF4139310.1 hypothetical protein GN958_ATG11526 [Phytophthora infestans]
MSAASSDEYFTPCNEDAALDEDTKTASIKAGSQDKNKRPRTSKDDGSRQRNPKRRQESTTLKKAESAETVAFAEKSVNGENATTLDASKTAETQVMSEIVEKQSTLETAETVETQKSVETTVANTESDDTQDMFDMKEIGDVRESEGSRMSDTGATGEASEKHASSMQVHVSDAVESDHTMATDKGDNDGYQPRKRASNHIAELDSMANQRQKM